MTASGTAARPTALEARHRRDRFFADRFPDFWATVERYDYALFEARSTCAVEIGELRAAAADAWRIYERVYPLLQTLPDAGLRDLGIPAAALDAVRVSYRGLPPTLVARFDFALTNTGFKVLELNAETPFFLWESFEIAGAVTRELGFIDPNAGADAALRAAYARAHAVLAPSGRVAVTAYNAYREDWFTASFIASRFAAATGRPVDVLPINELRAGPAGAGDARGRIDLLYRLYPLEHFAADPGAVRFFDHVVERRLALLNPPAALLLQTKLAQVVIWGLAERGAFFDERERAIVQRRFLPTYADAPAEGLWVRKPAFGREGNSVSVIRDGILVETSGKHSYEAQPMVYQRWVELPRVGFRDPRSGTPAHARAIHTCFVVDGKAGPVAMRVGDAISDAWSRFLPLATGCGAHPREVIASSLDKRGPSWSI